MSDMVSKWVWFWRAGFYRRAAWSVVERSWLKVRVERVYGLADLFYGDYAKERLGLTVLFSGAKIRPARRG